MDLQVTGLTEVRTFTILTKEYVKRMEQKLLNKVSGPTCDI